MGGAHSEHEDFAKSARRDVIDPVHMKMHLSFGSSINLLTSREKVSVHWGKSFHKIFFFWGGGGSWNV